MSAQTKDRIATVAFWVMGMTTIGILLFIILEIFARGIATALTPSFLFGNPKAIGADGGGIWPMIASTLYLAALTIVISVPISLGAAIYLAEFAREGRFTRFIRFCLDSLGTLPSIVFGIFGMTLFVIKFGWSYSLVAGACTLALLNLPIFLRGTEEALRLVPHTYREAAESLGASRWTAVKQIVIPTAMPGIITATILPIGRIMGESAAIIYTVGVFVPRIPVSPFDPGAPLAGYIWYVQTEAMVDNYRQIVNGGAAVLLILVLAINFGARKLASYYSKKKELIT